MASIWASGPLLAAAGLLSAATPAPTSQQAVDRLLATVTVTPGDAAAVTARCDVGLSLIGVVRRELEGRSGAASAGRDFREYDNIVALMAGIGGEMSIISQTSTAKVTRDAGQACIERLDKLGTEIGLSRPIYDRLAAIPSDGMDATTAYLLKKELDSYRRSGVDRDGATRAKIAALNNEITSIALTFDRNISEDTSTILLDGPAALAGMPQDYLDAHKPRADGKITLTTSYPDVFPIFEFADREETRRKVYTAFNNRAYPANQAVLANLIAKRQELARLLGFPNHAALVTANKMIETPERVQAFLGEVDRATDAGAQADLAAYRARYARLQPGGELNNWSSGYIGRILRKERYDVDSAVVRQYFTLDRTRQGIFDLSRDLFGADIRPWNTPVWAPGVTAWELYDEGTLVGRFFLDLSPREGKYSHAAAFGLREGLTGRQVPMAALICNFPATGPMSHGDVITFLHEFGHLLHKLYGGRQDYTLAANTALEWDFIEAPSQFLEEWAWDYSTLKTFTAGSDGQPIPAALVEKMRAARGFGEAMRWKRQLGLAAISLAYYSQPGPFDLDAVMRSENARYWPLAEPADAHMQASFTHLNGYSAIYYTYIWSKVIALDLFSRFETAGMRDKATAKAYRKAVLDAGGSKPAAQLIRDFLGRDRSIEAFRKSVAPAPDGAPAR